MFFKKKYDSIQAQNLVKLLYKSLLNRDVEEDVLLQFSNALMKDLTPLDLIDGIVNSTEYKGVIHPGHALDFDHKIRELRFIKSKEKKKIKNIIYFIPHINKPIGGVKVVISNCEIINSFSQFNVSAKLFSPAGIKPQITWLDNSTPIKQDNIFDVSEDFVIIPDLWALDYGRILRESGISYAIYVQNGYFLFPNIKYEDSETIKAIQDIYLSAVKLYTISDNTTECIKRNFSECENNIFQLIPSIDGATFAPSSNKKNIITYMPRKMISHSSWIINNLNLSKNLNWDFIAIDKIPEREVAEILAESKIFLAFSDLEGFALPPLEAALCGNIVIGYTGQAAKEYWTPGLFREIQCGDLFAFSDEIKKTMAEFERGTANPLRDYKANLDYLKDKYSKENETAKIELMVAEILSIN